MTGTMNAVRNGNNLQKGNKFHNKSGVAEGEWHVNNITEEEEISAVVEFQKTRFNARKEHGWRLFYDIP